MEPERQIRPKHGIIYYLRQILPYLAEYRSHMWIICLGSVMFGLVRLIDPNIYRVLVDDVLMKIGRGGVSPGEMWRLTAYSCGALFVLRVFSSGIFAWYTYLSMTVTQQIERKMFRSAVQHLQRLDMSFHHTKNSGEVLSRVERGIDATVNILHDRVSKTFLPNMINVVCLSVLIFWQDWRMAIAATFFIPFHVYFALRKAKPIFEEQKEINRLYEKIYHQVYEGIWNIEAVTSFNAAMQELEMFDERRGQAMERQMRVARWWRVLGFSSSFFEVIGRIAVIITGVWLALHNQTTVGAVVMFLAYISMLYQPLLDLITMYLDMQIGLSKIERLFDLLAIQPKVTDLQGATAMPPLRHAIEFKGVSFTYEGAKGALHKVDLTIPAGKKVALVGPSGAGKSTLVNLMLRYYNPSTGIVTADGTDLRKVTLASLHDQVTIVPQQAQLFSRTIRDNIAYGSPNSTDEQIQAAAKIANAHEFIVEREEGYDTLIGEKGVRLSGGQQQRISIARAVARNASVIILDEATSHLDSESEALVQEALWKLIEGKTAVMIAHRLSTVIKADTIVVIDGGRVIDQGTHAELLTRCELYQRLCNLQFQDANEKKDPV